jgi:hypothetical protein
MGSDISFNEYVEIRTYMYKHMSIHIYKHIHMYMYMYKYIHIQYVYNWAYMKVYISIVTGMYEYIRMIMKSLQGVI